jgi:pimeloyl-ACP methyl ester carboxylesterase
MTPPNVREWRDGGRWLPTAGGNVFVRSAAGDDPTILLLHGFPSSSYDFRSVIARLDQRSWLTLDFLGFGLSDKPRRHNYSLLEQADIVQQVVAELPGLGHYPQIEDPDAFTDAAVRLLSG